ncbi:MAG: DUF167 domain-containing protein [Candidatus Coatesbacteria bacterium]|nr:MAG: DUF167 domain-containing protein [Candidatus Coatesbacteria bacterium]
MTLRSSRTEVVSYSGGMLKVRLKAAPVDGGANEELVKFLSRFLKVPISSIEIKTGRTSKNKVVSVAGLAPADLDERLSPFK